MTRTAPAITFGLYTEAIKLDSTLACPDLQLFSKLTDIPAENIANRPYITMEQDFWLLDGGYKFMPTNPVLMHVGLMSLSMSDGAGAFAVPPVLTITFGASYSVVGGITLRFSQYTGDYADDVDIAFYDPAGVLIRTDNYNPVSWEFSTGQDVAGFGKIVITFNSTSRPYRYLRLTGVEYGTLIHFTGAEIKSAYLVEEIDPLSVELRGNTLELSVFSTDANFSIVNPAGDYAGLKDRQPIEAYETVGANTLFMGKFYLDEWENTSDNVIKFRCIDAVGVLDSLPYMGGIWLTPTTAGVLLEAIMTAAPMAYELDPDLFDAEIAGWIPICSYREALQLIAFAIGAYVTCSRSGVVRILKTTLAQDYASQEFTITKADKGAEQSLTLKTLVTGAEVTGHNYVSNSTVTSLYDGTLATGVYTIKFSAPQHDLVISGAEITSSGANYAVIGVAVAGTVTLTGQGYTDTRQVKGVYNTTLDSTVKPNIVSIQDATLINATNINATAQRVYDYYQQRYLQKVRLYAPDSEIGRSVLVETLYSQHIAGVTERMSIDLSGGFTANSEIVGVIA
jgi:hypothetical protein